MLEFQTRFSIFLYTYKSYFYEGLGIQLSGKSHFQMRSISFEDFFHSLFFCSPYMYVVWSTYTSRSMNLFILNFFLLKLYLYDQFDTIGFLYKLQFVQEINCFILFFQCSLFFCKECKTCRFGPNFWVIDLEKKFDRENKEKFGFIVKLRPISNHYIVCY